MNIDGIILAAGASTRFGSAKQLLPWTGADKKTRPLIQHVCDIVLSSNLRNVRVVLGYQIEQVRAAIRSLERDPRLSVVENKNFKEGQSTSIKTGLASLTGDTNAAMFLLCDQPRVSRNLIDALIELYAREQPLICLPVAGQVRGNPVIFSKLLFPELQQIAGDTGGRELIRKYPDRIAKLELDSPDMFKDIDTAQDLADL